MPLIDIQLIKGVFTPEQKKHMIQKVTDVRVLSLHHDISTVTGEMILAFTLAEPPAVRARGGISAAGL